MDKLRIVGGEALKGRVKISGAKNAALPLMAACLLTDEPFSLSNVPHLSDVRSMIELLEQHGVQVDYNPSFSKITFHAKNITNTTAPYDIVKKMRASFLVLGPLMARTGQARISLPGGCVIGTRPVDFHLAGLKNMGAVIDIDQGYVVAQAPQGLKGTEFAFPTVSVTGTENLMMAACLADGITILHNAAKEPEITDLADCLIKMGAKISGAGTETITIEGVDKLSSTQHQVIPDRLEAGSYMVAAMITNGDLILENARLDTLPCFADALRKAGGDIEEVQGGIRVWKRADAPIKGIDVITGAFPGFATDLQAQFMALMTLSNGAAMITETIFENRFMHVQELVRLGADITVHHSSALIRGVSELKGAPIMATDIRASFGLVLAALAAKGETIIDRIYHLDRGYEDMENKLKGCGAIVERI